MRVYLTPERALGIVHSVSSRMIFSYLNEVLGIERVLIQEGLHSKGTEVLSSLRPYLIFYDSQEVAREEEDLLRRILQALKWSPDQFQIVEHSPGSGEEFERTYFLTSSRDFSSKSSLSGLRFFIFGSLRPLPSVQVKLLPDQVICLPSLRQMLQDPQLKKQAWNKLKPFVSN